MAHQVLFTEDALADLEVVLEYIRAATPLRQRFGTSLLNHIELLQSFPRIGVPIRPGSGIRKMLHSPIRVYYRLQPHSQTIDFLHLWHAARKPPSL